MSAADALRRQDAEARLRAQREFVCPLVVEAGAGTGKTATLVARILAWCLGPGWQRAEEALAGEAADATDAERVAARVLSRVVSITFTEAAAAEMATRVEEALCDVEEGRPVRGLDAEGLPEASLRRARASALRASLDHLVVQTLHAYARRLLAAFPFEAGLHPQLDVDADGTAQRETVRRVLERALERAYLEESDALALAVEGYGPFELEAYLLELLNNGIGADELAGDPLAPDEVDALLERVRCGLAGFRDAARGRLAEVPKGRVAEETAAWIERLWATLDAAAAEVATLEALRDEALAGRGGVVRLRSWARGKLTQGEASALGDRAEAIAAASAELAPLLDHVATLDPAALARSARVLSGLLAQVEAELARQGVATFGTLLSGAAGLLVGRPAVASAIRRELDQLLVDEFQDTDPQQCALVASLALEGPDDERPGLFLVGDPKQSIYGWRDADLAAYEEFVQRALEAGGERHRLSVNHRSLPAVLDEVERVIEPVMVRAVGVQPAFERLVPSEAHAASRFEDGPRFAGIEYWVASGWDAEAGAPETTSAGDATRLEARALANDLCALQREGTSLGDVGLLFRSRGDWDVYLTALREAGVPFSVEGDRSYYRRREIIDAASWVRCVLDPHDSLALVGALRSTVVGVPDAAWIPLWSIGLPERVAGLARPDREVLEALAADVRRVAASLPDVPGLRRVAGWEHNLIAALASLAELRERFERDAADVFVERLRESLLLEASEASRFLGPWRVANLERFFRDLTERLAAGEETHRVLRALRQAVAEEEEMEEEPPHDRRADAVQVMTLHGAKGLDFEHVYLVQLHKGTGERPGPRLDAARIDGRLELRLLGSPSLGFDRALARRRRVTEAEHVRLLYVGMTRAKRRLVLSGAWPELLTRQHGLRHVDLLGAGRSLPEGEAWARAAAEGRSHVDHEDARFVLPALRSEVPEAGTAAETAVAADAESASAASGVTPQLRRAAQARMARPLGATVTGGGSDLEARVARWAGSEGDASRGPSPEVARLAGTAVHQRLERLDLSRPVEEALFDSDTDWEPALAGSASPEIRVQAARAAERLLAGLRGGALLGRLEEIRHHVVARELPVLLPAQEEDEALGFVSGAVDLVYRDPQDQAWVVVDFKTDRVGSETGLRERVAAHRKQGDAYARALQEALALPEPPRFELWFLAMDRWVAADQEPPSAPEQLSLTLA